MQTSDLPDHEIVLLEQRKRIDAIDQELVDLINRRSAIALEIGQIKMQHNLPIYVKSREDQVLQKIAKINSQGIVPQDEMSHIFQAIIQAGRAVQDQLHQDN